MASKESQVAAQVRLNQWTQEIQDCQNRPKDMTVDEWCEQHNIKKRIIPAFPAVAECKHAA